jgi:hypothetical protein
MELAGMCCVSRRRCPTSYCSYKCDPTLPFPTHKNPRNPRQNGALAKNSASIRRPPERDA